MDVQEWLETREGMLESRAAIADAWIWSAGRFPNADQTKFVAKVVGYKNHQISGAQIYYKKGMIATLGVDDKKWTKEMKGALGLPGYRMKPAVMITKAASVSAFPRELSPMKTKTPLPTPAEAAPSLKKIFNERMNFYATPDTFFVTKSGKYSNKPNSDTPLQPNQSTGWVGLT